VTFPERWDDLSPETRDARSYASARVNSPPTKPENNYNVETKTTSKEMRTDGLAKNEQR
jgi:hypothetical protein